MQSNRSHSIAGRRRESEAGFSLLEMVVAMVILTIGLLGVASAIGYALMASNSGRGLTNAKLMVASTLEQMETLRNTGQLNFDEISNGAVSGSSFAGFPSTFRAVSTLPGPDFVFGTADDDVSGNVPNVTRQILITPLCPGGGSTCTNPTLKRIQVTLRYSANGGVTKELVGVSYLNDDAHGNYVP
jgi:prepilin-type N-terminal cleavage/methylation domain-containing protein